MRFFLPILVALFAEASATIEEGDLVEKIRNATSPVNEGVLGGTAFATGTKLNQPVGPPVGAPGGERRLGLKDGDLTELIEAATSNHNDGVTGSEGFVPNMAIGQPVGPPASAGPPADLGGERALLDDAEKSDSVKLINADQPEEQRRRLCGYSVFSTKTCYLPGEEVIVQIGTCGGAGNAEWAGVYTDGAPVWPPLNWHYLCGGQGCNTAVAAGAYLLGFTAGTVTDGDSSLWPLPKNTPLRVYFHTGEVGSLQTGIFYVRDSCSGPPPPTPTPPPTPPPTPAPVAPNTPTCSETVSVSQNCWGLGQSIQVNLSTCGSLVSANAGWFGIYYAGTTNYAAALNWEYICGTQSCAVAVAPGSYTNFLDYNSYGSAGWPLSAGPTYQVYMHTGSGTFASNTFQITTTNSCAATPPPTPSPPSPTPPTSTSAPAANFGSNAPVANVLYVPASAADCNAVKNGQVVVGQDAMASQQFYFVFALGVNGQTLTDAQTSTIVTQAFQNLIGTDLLDCSWRRLLKKPLERQTLHLHNNENRHHRHNKHKRHHHHHKKHQRQLDDFAQRRRRLEFDEHVIGNIMFTTTCVESNNCAPLITQCYVCTTTAEVYLKGPADPAGVSAAIQEHLNSPTFLDDTSLADQDVAYIQPQEDVTLITAAPTSGPTSSPTLPIPPTPGPSSAPTSFPTNGPTSRPTNGPTSSPSRIPTSSPSSIPTSSPSSIPTSAPTSRPSAGPTLISTPTPTVTPTLMPTPTPTDEPMGPTPPGPSPTLFPDAPTGTIPPGELSPDPPIEPGSKGDPHFKTWKNEHFEYHGQCDIVLAKDPNFANGLGLDVHIRTKLIRFWSYIQSAVIRIGSDVLEIQGKPGRLEADVHYWINYEYRGELEEFSGFPVTVVPLRTRIDIDLSSVYPGQKISLSSFKEFVKISFGNASKEAFGNTVGILGNFTTGETLSRDGVTVLNDFTDLGEEWQVTPADTHLFRLSSFPQFPEPCIEPDDPRGDRMRRLGESSITEEQAEAACAGLKDELDRKDCVYDILATQDMDMAGAY